MTSDNRYFCNYMTSVFFTFEARDWCKNGFMRVVCC